MDYEQIKYETKDGILTITLNRPDKLNAFTGRMLSELLDAMDRSDRDDDVRAVVFTGAGRGFCAGADLSGGANTFNAENRGPVDPGLDGHRDGGGLFTLRAYESLKPTIAACNGPAVGVGITMQLAMDIRLASEAARYGLVNQVFANPDLERETYAWARRVAENSPEALRMAKIQMNKAQDAQGFTNAVEDSLGDYQAMMHMPGSAMRMEGERRLLTVDLAVRGRRGERFGLTPKTPAKAK